MSREIYRVANHEQEKIQGRVANHEQEEIQGRAAIMSRKIYRVIHKG